MEQRSQELQLTSRRTATGSGGRSSRRVQRGGFAIERAAVEALERALERLRRERGVRVD